MGILDNMGWRSACSNNTKQTWSFYKPNQLNISNNLNFKLDTNFTDKFTLTFRWTF